MPLVYYPAGGCIVEYAVVVFFIKIVLHDFPGQIRRKDDECV
jgi:hypothetical protein